MYSFQVFGTRRIGVFVNSLNGHLSCNPVVGEFTGVSLPMSFLNQYLCLVFIQKLSPGIKKKTLWIHLYLYSLGIYHSLSWTLAWWVLAMEKEKFLSLGILSIVELKVHTSNKWLQFGWNIILGYSPSARRPQKVSGSLHRRLVPHLAGRLVFPTFMPTEEGAAGFMGGARWHIKVSKTEMWSRLSLQGRIWAVLAPRVLGAVFKRPVNQVH